MEDKILYLTLKKEWFDMVDSGEKPEEYRELKDYWVTRLFDMSDVAYGTAISNITMKPFQFDYVHFTNGYGKHRPQIRLKCNGISIGAGNHKWGAPGNDCIIISLGNKVTF